MREVGLAAGGQAYQHFAGTRWTARGMNDDSGLADEFAVHRESSPYPADNVLANVNPRPPRNGHIWASPEAIGLVLATTGNLRGERPPPTGRRAGLGGQR